MPILREETRVEEYIEQIRKELTSGEISDIWLVVFLGALLYFGSGIVASILKIIGFITVMLGLYTIGKHLLGT